MRIIYSNENTKKQCTSLNEAVKLFGGDKKMAISLLARINAIEQASVIKDIILMPTFRFHKLKGKLKNYFSIDVKTSRDKWRIILRPLDADENVYDPCNIDQIASEVEIIEIEEVSPHYE